ncbi:MAG TPA: MMPL family transporter, partial [Clostridia bacterium]|nr:MMPL family transporter [Clostridia bacterium]
MRKYGLFISRHRVAVLVIAILLLIPALFGYIKTRINYDILSYLPAGIDSVDGETVLDKTFSDAATGMLVIEGMPDRDISSVKEQIKTVPGVENVIWKDDITDITVPQSMLPKNMADVFQKGNASLLLVQFKNGSSSLETQNAIAKIRSRLNRQCFLSGMSSIVKDTVDLTEQETPKYILLAVVLSLIFMSLTINSWLVPFLFLGSIGMAILYNLGSNVIFGEISFITKALAAVLQIGVTMDFAIFLYNRYEHELKKNPDREQAMAGAIANSFTAVFGSGLATTCGFLALGIMRLGLGKDIGFVMAKGVFLSVISTFTILPSLLLVFNGPIHKHT